jgi:hypothetical protein
MASGALMALLTFALSSGFNVRRAQKRTAVVNEGRYSALFLAGLIGAEKTCALSNLIGRTLPFSGSEPDPKFPLIGGAGAPAYEVGQPIPGAPHLRVAALSVSAPVDTGKVSAGTTFQIHRADLSYRIDRSALEPGATAVATVLSGTIPIHFLVTPAAPLRIVGCLGENSPRVLCEAAGGAYSDGDATTAPACDFLAGICQKFGLTRAPAPGTTCEGFPPLIAPRTEVAEGVQVAPSPGPGGYFFQLKTSPRKTVCPTGKAFSRFDDNWNVICSPVIAGRDLNDPSDLCKSAVLGTVCGAAGTTCTCKGPTKVTWQCTGGVWNAAGGANANCAD